MLFVRAGITEHDGRLWSYFSMLNTSSEPVPCHGNVWQNGDTYRNWLKKDVMAGTQSPECAKAVYDNMNISF